MKVFLILCLFTSVVNAQDLVPKKEWTLKFVDSEHTVNIPGTGMPNLGIYAIDGKPDTFWTTAWFDQPVQPKHPHEIQIDLNSVYTLNGFRYLGRQDLVNNGNIKAYNFYASQDGIEWGTPIATGELFDIRSPQDIRFNPVQARYVRMVALSSINNDTHTAMAELDLFQIAQGELTPLGENTRLGWYHDGINTVGYHIYVSGELVDISKLDLQKVAQSTDCPADMNPCFSFTVKFPPVIDGPHYIEVSAYSKDTESAKMGLRVQVVRAINVIQGLRLIP